MSEINFLEETGELLFASDTKLAIDVLDKRVTFEQDEVKSIKNFGISGMKLLGFKPLSSLKQYMYVKPGHFLYPDEKVIEGSTKLFGAFMTKCLEKKKFMLCSIIPRANASMRLVALIPQEEELNENRQQIAPPGFHLVYLPFADDFRKIDRELKKKPSEKNVDIFRKAISKLKFKYNIEDFKNPVLQKLWSEIEAIALDRNEPEEFSDFTVPNYERIEKRAGAYLSEFAEKFGINLDTKPVKRKAEADSATNKKLKTIETTDVESLANADKLETLTIPLLKQYIKSNKISANGQKKGDLIAAIKNHLNL